ncbi:DinB family protein [Falsibacillus albus]|uniref:DUF664 domain-containing protein n=1 Tax=Falsibacillus albus TaxID=2478915 RepID=A0A3L7JSE1_9BACI|nr:DinB family protein [Falsibacillus albus]RLQ93234.1 hypothetical protein D9X91_18570 [Falsibacillus albus]
MAVYQNVEAFIEEYRNESQSTLKLLKALTDESLSQEAAPGYRTLGELAWHLVHLEKGMLHMTGLKFDAPAENSAPPSTAAEIADAYESTVDAMLEAVETQWNDEKLEEVNNLFGFDWKNGLTLDIYLKHEIHHRGQLTIMMRLAGLPVSGVYGPSKEEWSTMGMEAPAY